MNFEKFLKNGEFTAAGAYLNLSRYLNFKIYTKLIFENS